MNYYNTAVAQKCLPDKYKKATKDASIQAVKNDLLWTQNKIDKLWDGAYNFSYNPQYGNGKTCIDPRLLLAVILQEGTGSFNTNFKPNSSKDGGGYIQPDFEKDLKDAFYSHIMGKFMAYSYFAKDFRKVSLANQGKVFKVNGTNVKYKGEGDFFEYLNNDTPRLCWNGSRYSVKYGVYAEHYEWSEGIRSFFKDLVNSENAAVAYSSHVENNPIKWPDNLAIPSPEFQLTRVGTNSNGSVRGYPMIIDVKNGAYANSRNFDLDAWL